MYNIVFSIPIHESPESILDQIINYNRFNENCAIVFHMSASFSYKYSQYNATSFFDTLSKFKNVFINPEHLRTGYADIIQTHISNFFYIQKIIEFEYFSIGASNDLFVKSGLYNRITGYDAGYTTKFTVVDKQWVWYKSCFEDSVLHEFLKEYNKDESSVVISQIEGCFYRREIFDSIAKKIMQHYDYQIYDFKGRDKEKTFPREEVYFSTLAKIMFPNIKVLKKSYSYVAFDIRISHIPRIKSVVKYSRDDSEIYNVKRINRVNSDPLRAYIREKIGEYYKQERELIGDVKKCNYFLLYVRDIYSGVNSSKFMFAVRRIIRKILRF